MRRTKLTCIRLLLLNSMLFCLSQVPCAAQELLTDERVRIARHDRRVSRFVLRDDKESTPIDHWGIVFRRSFWEEKAAREEQLLHYEELPNCSESKTSLEEVFQLTPGSDAFDVLYYSADDKEQRKKARGYFAYAVAYNSALIADPDTNIPDQIQEFARFIGIECLPTRFRFTFIGSRRYMEFRTGDKAWEKTDS